MREREAGEFCWINILTSQPPAAMVFFGKVLGWSFAPMPPFGQTIRVGDGAVGGLFDLDAPECPPGLEPTIGVLIRVDDADATVERVQALGGRAKPAFTIADRGRMAVCHDPAGAKFDIWQPLAHSGMESAGLTPGGPSWFESLSTDPDQAIPFYAELFGWTAETREVGGGFSYTTFQRGSVPIAGLMRVPMPEIPSHWGTYFTVNDADETARRATEAGGQLFVPPRDIPGVGRFCGIRSPQGVRFYAIRYLPGFRS